MDALIELAGADDGGAAPLAGATDEDAADEIDTMDVADLVARSLDGKAGEPVEDAI